ncbi:phage holin family protein [Mycobacterium sp.]|uniref:phage holin family protein n=1 Tax=Mycobacterium sp. TaxID=1785 RepID=UPI003F9BDDC2
MLIIALVLALVGLVALVFAVVTSNELVAWVCIAASVLGVVLLIIDAVQERRRPDAGGKDEGSEDKGSEHDEATSVDYPEEVADDESSTEGGTEATEESAVSAEGRGDDHA